MKYNWKNDKEYGTLFYKRATGELPEMECSKSLSEEIKKIYSPKMSILDVGCGVGHYLRSFRKRVDKNIIYTGVDITERYIKLAQKIFPTARFKVGDALDLPFPSNSFNIVFSNNLIQHMALPLNKFISELIRVSKTYVILRYPSAKDNYIIKEAPAIDEKGNLKDWFYLNLYTDEYIKKVVGKNLKIDTILDNSGGTLKGITNNNDQTALRLYNNKLQQVSGSIILNFKYLIIRK